MNIIVVSQYTEIMLDTAHAVPYLEIRRLKAGPNCDLNFRMRSENVAFFYHDFFFSTL